MTDYSRAEIQRKAADAIKLHGGPELVRVFYKWSCAGCGSRNVVQVPNELPERSVCPECGMYQPIYAAGFGLHIRRDTKTSWEPTAGRLLIISKQRPS